MTPEREAAIRKLLPEAHDKDVNKSLCAACAANDLLAEVDRLREALVKAAVPLEVLAWQVAAKPYRELTPEFQREIQKAALAVRDAVLPRTEP